MRMMDEPPPRLRTKYRMDTFGEIVEHLGTRENSTYWRSNEAKGGYCLAPAELANNIPDVP